MKYLTTLLFAAIFLAKHATAQTIYCGLTYSYDAAGNRIQRIVTADCDPGHRMMVVTDTTTIDSIKEGLKEILFPNPTTGQVSVVFNTPVAEAQITVTDNLGRQLYSTTASGTSIPLDISRFAEGLYFILVRAQGNTVNRQPKVNC